MASSFLLVSAAETTGEISTIFETIHQFAGNLLLGQGNRQENEALPEPVLARLVKIGGGLQNQKIIYDSIGYVSPPVWRACQTGRYSDINTNRARAINTNAAILVR